MSSLALWLRCLGRALSARAARALAGSASFGDRLNEIAGQMLHELGRAGKIDEALLATARASGADAAAASAEIVTEIGDDLSPSGRQSLERILALAPALARAGLRRFDDATGQSLPAGTSWNRPEDLLPFLPVRSPRWHTGARPKGVGGLELTELLGISTAAELWLARRIDAPAEPLVALKFLVERRLADAVRRDERRLQQVHGAAQHPGLVTLHRLHDECDPLCIEYEHVAAGNLLSLIRAGRALEASERATRAIRVLLRLARIVGHCHRLSPALVLRDLKPSNVLVEVRSDGELELRVCDLATGLHAADWLLDRDRRRAIPAGEANAARRCGRHTPLHASPQQARGMKADPRDDVYALGVLWCQLLTADPCSSRPDGKDWTRQLPESGEALALLARCCERDPDRRPADALALAERLADVLAKRGPSATLTVAPQGGDHAALADAVRAAPPGARILVRPGIYTEGIFLDKPLEIVAEGKPGEVVVETTDASCLIVQTERATVRGLTFRCQNKAGMYFAVEISRGRALLEDCDITCAALAGVAIHGGQANPTLRRCAVHHCHESGVFIYDNGKGRFEDCDLHDNRLSALEVKTGGNPVVRHCKLRGSSDGSGIYVYEKGRGTFEGCDIFGNQRTGVRVKDESDPTLRRCTVRDGQQGGVYFSDRARGTLVQCEIAGNQYANVEIKTEANPTVRECRIHGSKQGGVFVYERGRGVIADCDIHANRLAGIEVKEHGEAVIERCILRDSIEGGGYFAYDEGKGSISDCDIHGNKCAGVEIRAKADPIVRRCRIHASREGSGVFAWEEARGELIDCDVHANKLAGITVRAGAAPVVRDCKFHDNGEAGIFVYQGGAGTYTACACWANQLAGVEVREDGNPTVTRCRIHDGKAGGIFVYDKGKGRFDDCDVLSNGLSNVEIKQEGDPVVIACRLRDAATNGVFVYEGGKGLVENCEILDSSLCGLRVQQQGEPTVKNCRIRGTKKGPGVLVQEDGKGTIAHCAIGANAGVGVEIGAAGAPLVRDCRINDNKGVAVRLLADSLGAVSDCDVTGNAGGPWSIDSASQTSRSNNRE